MRSPAFNESNDELRIKFWWWRRYPLISVKSLGKIKPPSPVAD
jgi:hypothetical protein